MNQTNNLSNSVQIYNSIREQLALEFDLLPEDQCLADTLEGLSDLPELIAAIVRDSVRTKAMSDAIKIIIADNQSRKMRFDAKAERLRALALYALTEAGIPRIDAPDLTITNSDGPKRVIITDIAAVPDEFCKIERTPRKLEIAEELKRGAFVPYAVWSNPERILKVHTK